MPDKLTERTELGGASQAADLFHVVRGGVSYKRTLANILLSPIVPYRYSATNVEMIIFRKDPTIAQSGVLEEDDIAIYINNTDDTMIIGIAVAQVSTYPTDLNDRTKFLKYYEGNSLL